MFLAVSLATLTIIVATHSVKDRNAGPAPAEPSAPQCKTFDQVHGLLEDQAAIQYCIYR